jgi:hypothetical protein
VLLSLSESDTTHPKIAVHDSPEDSLFFALLPGVLLLSKFVQVSFVQHELFKTVDSHDLLVVRLVCEPFDQLHFFHGGGAHAFAVEHSRSLLETVVGNHHVAKILVCQGLDEVPHLILQMNFPALSLLNKLVVALGHHSSVRVQDSTYDSSLPLHQYSLCLPSVNRKLLGLSEPGTTHPNILIEDSPQDSLFLALLPFKGKSGGFLGLPLTRQKFSEPVDSHHLQIMCLVCEPLDQLHFLRASRPHAFTVKHSSSLLETVVGNHHVG